MSDPTPAPGSIEATDAGCTCPIVDNGFGRGRHGEPGTYVFTCGCPIHSPNLNPDGSPKSESEAHHDH